MRVVFLRSGWMDQYCGVQAGDEAPIGGGSHNENSLGHERFNFLEVKGKLYGFVQSKLPSGGLNLFRIDEGGAGKSSLPGVLAVFVATHPTKGGQRVVGWYRGARVYGAARPAGNKRRDDCTFQVVATAADAVLLPSSSRKWRIPTGAGGMSTTHVRYPRSDDGTLALKGWMKSIITRIETYSGPNLLRPISAQLEEGIADQVAELLGKQGQGGFQPDSAIRRAVELQAMKQAIAHFGDNGWEVEDTSAKNPFDLLIKRKGEEVRVEVKGTTGEGDSIILTRAEVESARAVPSALVICAHIGARYQGDAVVTTDGVLTVRLPWDVNTGILTPISYFYAPLAPA